MNFTKERGVYMVKKWIIRLIALLCVLSAAFLIADAISGPDEPAFCALCHGAPLHAPALLNIETGDLTELRIYEPHPHKAGELAENQQGGYMGISMNGGVYFTYDPDAQIARTTIPLDQARLHKSEFCQDCRKLLADSKQKYVIVDVYDQENISVYDIVEGICCEMRCYTVSAAISGDKTEVTITVKGTLTEN